MAFSSIPVFRANRWSDGAWIFMLLIAGLMMLTPGFFSIPPVDRDETRFAQASRQMVASGDYIDIRFQDGTRYKKPIGIYWLQSASVSAVKAVSGKAQAPIWAYRLPSLLAALASLLLTYWIARAFLSPAGAGLAGLMMTFCVLLGVEARIAKTDATLLATILVAQGILARAWLYKEKRLSSLSFAAFWISVAAGILIKGPIILLVTGTTFLTLTVLDRSFGLIRRLRPLSGIALTLALVLPWFIAIGLKSDGAFFIEAGLVDFLAKVASVKESHGGPPGLYALVMSGTFWPASIFLLISLPVIFKNRREKPVLFALSWLIPSWIVFELTSTKLPHYVLPLYPALALLIGYAFFKEFPVHTLWRKVISSLLFIAPAALSVTAFGGLIYLEGHVSLFLLLTCLLTSLTGFIAWRFLQSSQTKSHAVLFAGLSALSLYIGIYQFAFPNLQLVWVSNRMIALSQSVPKADTCPAPSVISVGYHEPSLAFLGPLDLRFQSETEAAASLKQAPCRQVFVTGRAKDTFLAEAENNGLTLAKEGELSGFKLNGGDTISITLYRARKPEDEAGDG